MTGKRGRKGNGTDASKSIVDIQETEHAPIDGISFQSIPSNVRLCAATQVKKGILYRELG